MILKYSFLFFLLLALSILGIMPRKKTNAPAPQVNMNTASLNFDTDVKPIFEKHCNPCHFPGGKLYERLPFDQASTIIKNEKGILRRISDTGEVKVIQEFVEENKSGETVNSN